MKTRFLLDASKAGYWGEMRYVLVGTTSTVGTGVTGRENLSRNYCLNVTMF